MQFYNALHLSFRLNYSIRESILYSNFLYQDANLKYTHLEMLQGNSYNPMFGNN